MLCVLGAAEPVKPVLTPTAHSVAVSVTPVTAATENKKANRSDPDFTIVHFNDGL